MATLFVRHTVSDYNNWRKGYDAFDPTRKALGVTAHAVYRADDNPNDVTVTHEFPTVAAAQAFAIHESIRRRRRFGYGLGCWPQVIDPGIRP